MIATPKIGDILPGVGRVESVESKWHGEWTATVTTAGGPALIRHDESCLPGSQSRASWPGTDLCGIGSTPADAFGILCELRDSAPQPQLQPKSTARTVRVRIAVAVDPAGGWSAWGGSETKDHVSMSYAIDGVGEGEARHWVEADLPVPESKTVRGVVTQEGA